LQPRRPGRYDSLIYLVKGSDGNFYGPADLTTLNQWAAEGRVLADTVLVDQVTQQQVTARDMPGLSHHFIGAPVASGQTSYNPYQSPPSPSGTNYPRGQYTPYGGVAGPPKSKVAAALLAFFVGVFGIHRFYLGHTGIGVAQLLITVVGGVVTCGLSVFVTSIWSLIDMVLILTGQIKDVHGQPLE
jgi:TM2 domain-containing membrane protein YozV